MQAVSPSPSLRLAAAPQCNAQSIAPVARAAVVGRTDGKGVSAQLAEIHPREREHGGDWKRDRGRGEGKCAKSVEKYQMERVNFRGI